MDEQTRLLALAYLKNGKSPADTAETCDISYSTALKLRRELIEAEKVDKVRELFKLPEAALEILLDSVTKQLTPAIEAFGIGELVDEEVKTLTNGINGGKLLSEELQGAASVLVNKINQVSVMATNAETIVTLADALCRLQIAFKTSDINSIAVNNFEKHLKA